MSPLYPCSRCSRSAEGSPLVNGEPVCPTCLTLAEQVTWHAERLADALDASDWGTVNRAAVCLAQVARDVEAGTPPTVAADAPCVRCQGPRVGGDLGALCDGEPVCIGCLTFPERAGVLLQRLGRQYEMAAFEGGSWQPLALLAAELSRAAAVYEAATPSVEGRGA